MVLAPLDTLGCVFDNRPVSRPLNRSDMGLLSFLKRNASAPAAKPVADTSNAVQQLRVRARRRLMGAVVLVAIGIVGFPLLFETQPRPIPVDLPIEIPRKDNVAVLPVPAAPKETRDETQRNAGVVSEPAERKSTAPAAASSAVAAAPSPKASAALSKTAENAVEKSGEGLPAKAKDKSAKADEAERVKALLDGKPAADADKRPELAVRYVVQVGAFADAGAAHDTRLKVEKLGLKTYAQVIQNAEGKRTRVRVGPFTTRDEADKVASRIRAAGLSAAILTL
jgi:DedD protein